MSIQEPGACVVLNVHPKKSGNRKNFPDSIALLFSLSTFHTNFAFNCQTSHDMTVSCSSSLFDFHCLHFLLMGPDPPSCDLLNTGHFTEQSLSGYVIFC